MGFVAAGLGRARGVDARGSMLAPVVDVTQRILDERLVLVVPPLAIHDELVLVVPRRQVAHHREHAAPVGRGLGGHRHRLQPVSERPAQVDLRALAIGWVSRGRDLGVRRGFEIDDRVGRRRDCRDTRGRATRGERKSRRGRAKFRRVSRSRTHLLAAVAPHEPGGEHHLLVHGLLRHGVRSPSELQRPRRDSVPLHV